MKKERRFCTYCGTAFDPREPWPRTCRTCKFISYLNPFPVVVLLVPVDDGVLLIRRGEPPHRGRLALPGGYIEGGETWQEAAARELQEEAQVEIDPRTVTEFRVRSAGDTTLLVFGEAPRLESTTFPRFEPHPETMERLVVSSPVDLAFPLHTEALRAFFEVRLGWTPGRRPRGR